MHLWDQMVRYKFIMPIPCPEGCLMNVFILDPHLMEPDLKSILENTFSPLIWSKRSSILGKGYLFFIVVCSTVCNQYITWVYHLSSLQTESVLSKETHLAWYTSSLATLAVACSALEFMVCSSCRVSWTLVLLLAQVQWWNQCPFVKNPCQPSSLFC